MINLGPRHINYTSPDGSAGTIKISVTLEGRSPVTIADDVLDRMTGRIDLSCELFTKTMKFEGEDDLQLIMRLLWLSDVWLRKMCKENDLQIYKWTVGDIEDELSVYKP